MNQTHSIGGETGGVGESVMTRVLAQHSIDHHIPFQGLDSDCSHGSLMRFDQGFAEHVGLEDFQSPIASQMQSDQVMACKCW